MDLQSLLETYPTNLLIVATALILLCWWLRGRAVRRAQQLQREQADAELAALRRDLLGQIDTKSDDIAQLENRLAEADHLTQRLSQKASLLAHEQQRYADLKDRYLQDISRARSVLKTRADAGAELQRRNEESAQRYKELHRRWDTERKRYAALVTDKNQQIAELESRLEGTQLPDSQDVDPSLHSYSHGQLEAMLVDLRHQLAASEETVAGLRQRLREGAAAAAVDTADTDTELQRLRAELAERERQIAAWRERLLQQQRTAASAPATATPAPGEPSAAAAEAALQRRLESLEVDKAQLTQELERLRGSADKLRRLETRLQQLLRDEPGGDALTGALELEVQQLHGLLSRERARAQRERENQARAFQRQLNAKTDTIGRLNRQLQAGRDN